ncbi:MAG: hypothetical protein RIG62_26730 [Cyclobacteriaceae bacterium]
MNKRSESAHPKYSFFKREPKFSVLIVASSMVVLLIFVVFFGFDNETSFSDLFCHQSLGKVAKTNLYKIKDFFDQITIGSTLMPR